MKEPITWVNPGDLLSTEMMYPIHSDVDRAYKRSWKTPKRHWNPGPDDRVPVFVVAVSGMFFYIIKEHMIGWIASAHVFNNDPSCVLEVKIKD
jgi:hypothetical protein